MQNIDKVALILIQNRKILMARSIGKDLFYFPGGKRKGDETDTETLVREIKEELGVTINAGALDYLETFSAQADNKPEGVLVVSKCYKTDYGGDLLPQNEIEEIRWFTTKDISKITPIGLLIFDYLKVRDLID